MFPFVRIPFAAFHSNFTQFGFHYCILSIFLLFIKSFRWQVKFSPFVTLHIQAKSMQWISILLIYLLHEKFARKVFSMFYIFRSSFLQYSISFKKDAGKRLSKIIARLQNFPICVDHVTKSGLKRLIMLHQWHH